MRPEDLKIGKFTHADAGQMNLYLNYAQENLDTAGRESAGSIDPPLREGCGCRPLRARNLKKKDLAREYQLALPKESELKARLKQVRLTLTKDLK